ncbi:hypothetical protein [Legionella saoudiensis]|uniref:hypothetical protein n=1 Tax=Legionella saoudiensis TaxID=1750561 RepID=UPI000731B2D9|nr:hypothetical protein [Legionella saoudiensis]
MPYLVKGNALQLFSAFGYPEFVMQTGKPDNAIAVDLSRTPFLGNETQANQHLNIWSQDTAAKYYTQGDQSAEILKFLLGACPLKKVEENEEEYQRNFVCQRLAYIDDNNENCGMVIMYRRDEPDQWMIGFTRKAHMNPRTRSVTLFSSFDLNAHIKDAQFELSSCSEPTTRNQFLAQLNAAAPVELLLLAFNAENDEINPRFERIRLLLRFLKVNGKKATIADPIDLSKINLPQLFAENPALDLIVKYNVPFSMAMLQDCLSENSKLRHELENVTLSSNEQISRNLLDMTAVLYEEEFINKIEGALNANRYLLHPEFIKDYSGFMWDREQIILLPILHQRKYPKELIHQILSNDYYFRPVNRLTQLMPGIGFTQNVPQFFQQPEKLNALEFINDIADVHAKDLCLILWATSSLTIDGYKEIVAATNQYPLMASTLVSLAKKGTIPGGFDGLRSLALAPHQHLKQSIITHFFLANTEARYAKSLNAMTLNKLEAVSEALQVLRSTGVGDQTDYRMVLGAGKEGTTLRTLLPPLAAIKDSEQRRLLVDVLYAGVRNGIPIQGDVVLKIKNQEHQAVAKKLRERFICVTQLQDLDFDLDMIAFAARENDKKAECFRKIILSVEDECKKISSRLSKSYFYLEMGKEWEKDEGDYRKSLYGIAYRALISAGDDAQAAFNEAKKQIQEVEKKMLATVDPAPSPETSKLLLFLSDALIFITNAVISLLSAGLCNYFKEKATGNYWFFTQTRSGEAVRMFTKEMINSLEPEASTLGHTF